VGFSPGNLPPNGYSVRLAGYHNWQREAGHQSASIRQNIARKELNCAFDRENKSLVDNDNGSVIYTFAGNSRNPKYKATPLQTSCNSIASTNFPNPHGSFLDNRLASSFPGFNVINDFALVVIKPKKLAMKILP